MLDAKKEDFLKRLRATFHVEAGEHLRAISAGLIALEKTPESAQREELIEAVFRAAHSLKGAARSVSLQAIESIGQALESVFAALKRREIAMSAALCDLAHQAVDEIARLVASPKAERTLPERSHAKNLIQQLERASRPVASPEQPQEPGSIEKASSSPSTSLDAPQAHVHTALLPPTESKAILLDTVRMPTSRLEPLLLQAEETILAKMAAEQRVADVREINRALASWRTGLARWKHRSSAAGATPWTEILEWNETQLNALQHQTATVTRALEQDFHVLSRMVDDHLAAMKSVLMLPVSVLTEGFPKLVRDLAREQGKEVELVLRGTEVEIDKRVLEELKDPLVHLLRNSVDHGIEKPEARLHGNKLPRGTVTMTFAARESRQAEIVIADDGAGIDLERVRSAAVKAGILSPEAAGELDPQITMSLVFQSGVTTSAIVTNISGRGLGLAIVREKVEKLGGTIAIATEPGAGATFRLLVPLTLATFKGILVRVREQVFVLPGVNVERVARARQTDIKTVENQATIRLDGQVLALVKLDEVLDLPARAAETRSAATHYVHVLVLASAEKRIAVQVDEILDEQEVLVKGLGAQLSRVRYIAGATILGTGKVAPVLDVANLMKSAARPHTVAGAPSAIAKPPEKPGNILVAEDSITSRTLLKNILEAAGYRVTAAVDGVDAFTKLRGGEFDLVVSDVDMPRMNGFELTVRIRADKKLGEMPVVLVTALESREDRERGIEVGANAYIVKSSFEQSNLLEVVGRLI